MPQPVDDDDDATLFNVCWFIYLCRLNGRVDRFDTIVFKSSVVLSPIWIIIVDDGGVGDDNFIISLSSLYYQFFRMI